MKWVEKILSAPNHDGFRARREPYMVHGGEKGPKKIPSLRIEDWGFYPLAPFTVLSSKTSS
jgi:hypothetical protein